MTAKTFKALLIFVLVSTISNFADVSCAQADDARKIVIIAGEIDAGHAKGTHEYQKAALLFQRELRPLEQVLNFKTEVHFGGWPTDEKTLASASTIVLISDGADRRLEAHPFLVGDRLKTIERQMDRGCGLVQVHWSTFWPEKYRDKILAWVGGYFDYESGPEPRNWFSKIKTQRSQCKIASPEHPICNGVKEFHMQEEFYYNIQFTDEFFDILTPILETKIDGEEKPQTVAWSLQRKESGGRGFGFTGGHFLRNWQDDNLRRLMCNAILWTANIDPPPRGVQFQPKTAMSREVDILDPGKINTLIVTGNQHPAHEWRTTTSVLVDGLAHDQRIATKVVDDIEYLADDRMQDFDVILLNYCNWKKPGLSEKAKSNFTKFLRRGGGLILIHFANGAFHFSLPESADSDWPEYRKICRRVWDHTEGKSGHDAFGKFKVELTDGEHPITKTLGVDSFETVDELYFRQQGSEEIKVLATAKSSVTGNDEAMAFVYQYGNGQIFQTVLGHSAESLRVPEVAELIRNAVAWCAKRKVNAKSIADQNLDAEYLAKWTPKKRRDSRFAYENEGESDWVDARFSKMDTGMCFNSSIITHGKGITPKAMAIKVSWADDNHVYTLFDTETFNVRAVWSGKFLDIPPDRFGILKMPSIAGDIQYVPTWNSTWSWQRDGKTIEANETNSKFIGYYDNGHSTTLRYRVGETEVHEVSVGYVDQNVVSIERRLTIDPCKYELTLPFLNLPKGDIYPENIYKGRPRAIVEFDDKKWFVMLLGSAEFKIGKKSLAVKIPPGTRERNVAILVLSSEGRANSVDEIGWATNTKKRWPAELARRRGNPIVTKGRVSTEKKPLVVDTIEVPYQNEFNALMFTSGVDFLPDGRAFVCTIHGDVWLVDGIDEDLGRITWQRFATGLYQPLGIKVVDGKPIVMCRDRMMRLHDLNDDGEADYYENFNDDLKVTGQPHAYAMSLETDPHGNFYFIKSGGTAPHGGTMVRVSPDGEKMDVFATGYRHANGLGVSPTGIVTSADNEGNWIPSTRIDVVKQGGFYGHMPTHRRETKPETYDGPLCWLPRELDNSAGGQVWVENEQWKKLNGKMLHLSFGRCTLNLVLQQKINDGYQGGAMNLDIPQFLSGAMRGKFNKHDGHLYVTGLDGWQTAAVRDGCLQRVRATGLPFNLPTELKIVKDGIEIAFSDPINARSATNLANWKIEQWNYRWTSAYGSEHYSVTKPEQPGHDLVKIDSIQIDNERNTLHLKIAEIRPVMQMNIRATIKAQNGSPINLDLYNTIREVPGRE